MALRLLAAITLLLAAISVAVAAPRSRPPARRPPPAPPVRQQPVMRVIPAQRDRGYRALLVELARAKTVAMRKQIGKRR